MLKSSYRNIRLLNASLKIYSITFNKNILSTLIQNFIKNYSESISTLALRGTSFENVTTHELIQQIESRQKAEKKLPLWFSSEGIYYPPKLNIEQTSSELTAIYKAGLIEGKTLIDITGGFGVDSYYFSKRMLRVTHCEEQKELSAIATHNFKQLGAENIRTIAGNGLVHAMQEKFDVIYIDPSRRHASKGKVFFLSDCAPNVPENLDSLLAHCDTLLLKTSPMLDISVGLSELHHVKEVHIVAVANEVKELIWVLKNDGAGSLQIKTVNQAKAGLQVFEFPWNATAEASYSQPLTYLYEPNAAIMKSGAFQQISEAYGLGKLHIHSHLYTSETLIDFPGRRFSIERLLPYSKKNMRELGLLGNVHVSIRNFPMSVAALRKKWKLNEGGDHYLFFTTAMDENKIVLVCKKV